MADSIDFSDFLKVDVRVGTILEAKDFPEARNPAYKLTIDFGKEVGTRNTSAQITKNYTINDLVGRQVLAVINFPPKQIGPFISECLTLGVPDEDGEVTLLNVDKPVPNGGRVY